MFLLINAVSSATIVIGCKCDRVLNVNKNENNNNKAVTVFVFEYVAFTGKDCYCLSVLLSTPMGVDYVVIGFDMEVQPLITHNAA